MKNAEFLDEKDTLMVSIKKKFNNLKHTNKSYQNLKNLSKIIAEAYKVSPIFSNQLWNILWEENKKLPGMQRRYFILVIYKELTRHMSTVDAISLLLMEKYRLLLILEFDSYGSDDALKDLLGYTILYGKYSCFVDLLDAYKEINNLAEPSA